MLEKVMKILKEINSDIDFESEELLIDDGILDSFDIIALANELEEEFQVDINVEDLEPDNFNTPEAIVELIQALQED